MLKLEMGKWGINLLGISEMRWPNKGDFWSGDYRVIHTGNEPTHGTAGVGVVLDKKLGQLVDSYLQFSARILLVRIKTKPTDTVIVQVYMPTSACEDEEMEVMYENLEEVIKYIKGQENLIVMGDWNAIVGEGQEVKTIKRVFQDHKPRVRNIKDSEGRFLIRDKEIVSNWKNYLETLYGDNKLMVLKEIEKEESIDTESLGDSIRRSEFDLAIELLI